MKQAGEIGELKGKLDALATKDFVRMENASLLKEITEKLTTLRTNRELHPRYLNAVHL